jgi:23S rRNA (cytosine1962-C5)-methyltransferase
MTNIDPKEPEAPESAAPAAPAGAAPAAPSTAVLSRRGARRSKGLHPWIYASDVERVNAESGQAVRVLGPRGRELGWSMYSEQSQISLRSLDHRGGAPDREFWRNRIAAAVAYRETLGIEGNAYRLAHAEADSMPSIIVDRYDDILVLQCLSQGAAHVQPLLTELLVEQLSPRGILARNDSYVRDLEGLERVVEVLHGEVPERVEVAYGGARMDVDLRTGQKTGLFLDQRENREAAARYAHGRLLDCFSYHGAFAVRLAPHCDETIAVEISDEASPLLRRNADLNGVDIEVRTANAFDHLRELEAAREKFDTIVLDPPAFAKNRGSIKGALNGYKEINLRAMRLLRPGGHLVTCSCSYHVDLATFHEVVEAAAKDVHAHMNIIEVRSQSKDHPVRLGMPESSYLKCLILRRQD